MQCILLVYGFMDEYSHNPRPTVKLLVMSNNKSVQLNSKDLLWTP